MNESSRAKNYDTGQKSPYVSWVSRIVGSKKDNKVHVDFAVAPKWGIKVIKRPSNRYFSFTSSSLTLGTTGVK